MSYEKFISTLKEARQLILYFLGLSGRRFKSKKSKRRTRLEIIRMRRDMDEQEEIARFFGWLGRYGNSIYQKAIRLQLPTRPDNVLHFGDDWWKVANNKAEEKYLVDRTEAELMQLIREAEAQIPKTTGGGQAGKTTKAQPLSRRAAAVYEILKSLPEHSGITGTEIINKLSQEQVYIDQSTLTKNIIPVLKKSYKVQNKPRIGYYIEK